MNPSAPLPTPPHRPDDRLRSGHPAASTAAAKSYDTAQLFGADSEVEIVHQHTVYRLKITRQGKLILNK